MTRASTWAATLAVALVVAGCEDAIPVAPASAAARVRELARSRGMEPIPPPPPVRPALVELGRMLAFDKVLSGDRDVSCMTCHLPSRSTTDARTLPLGVGGIGRGPNRAGGTVIPRNALAFFNLHRARGLFWDSRIEMDPAGELRTPLGDRVTPDIRATFEFGALSAIGLFPVFSREEMRGAAGNDLAAIPDDEPRRIWDTILARLGAIAEYRDRFEAAYPGVPFEAMNPGHVSNAIAGFLVSTFAADRTPWDRFLAGDDDALDAEQLAGAEIFLGEGRCAECHSGPDLSDHRFHNTALAQLGPGEGQGPGGIWDFGREGVTGDPAERFAFRTPGLRNVELTAPYGHAGQFATLRGMVDHYSRSDEKLPAYDPGNLDPTLRFTARMDATILATRDPRLDGLELSDEQIDLLVAFLHALTDERSRALDGVAPASVPSGLPVDR